MVDKLVELQKEKERLLADIKEKEERLLASFNS